jgi:hypothetical protein
MNSLIRALTEANSIDLKLAESGGEITPEIQELMDIVDLSIPEAIDREREFLLRLEAFENEWRTRLKPVQKQPATLKKIRENRERAIKELCAQAGKTELVGNDYVLCVTPIKPRLAIDPDKIPEKYKRTVTVVEIDEEMIEQDLHLGLAVEGAELKPNFQLRFKLNRSGGAK